MPGTCSIRPFISKQQLVDRLLDLNDTNYAWLNIAREVANESKYEVVPTIADLNAWYDDILTREEAEKFANTVARATSLDDDISTWDMGFSLKRGYGKIENTYTVIVNSFNDEIAQSASKYNDLMLDCEELENKIQQEQNASIKVSYAFLRDQNLADRRNIEHLNNIRRQMIGKINQDFRDMYAQYSNATVICNNSVLVRDELPADLG